MKNVIILINLVIIFVVTAIFSTPPKQRGEGETPTSKQVAVSSGSSQAAMDVKSTKSFHQFLVDDIVSEFIVESADARLMDLEEGKMATQRCTSRALKDYGSLMVQDQARMLADLKIIATRKRVKLPSGLSEKKNEGLTSLKKEHGKSFDKKFVKMMILDHKRDLKMFEKATRSNDVDIKLFATKYLPVVQSHLDQIRTLKKKI